MDKTVNGIIIKCLGGLYTVESPDGIFECKARGIFRTRGISPCAGDNVEISGGVIDKILERRNYIIRPPLANLDQLVFVVSTCEPSPDLLLLDKFIAIAVYKKIKPIVVITKIDIGKADMIKNIYKSIGMTVLKADYSNPETIEAIRRQLAGKISAFTGNSGAGKSTLLNAIEPNLRLPTAEISRKLGRGRHTTRHAELYKFGSDGYIADTPGFSTFDTNKYDLIRKEELAGCFPEFSEYYGKCKFRDCSHTCEKGCAVIEALKDGKIQKSRHDNYCAMYEEASKLKEWELK